MLIQSKPERDNVLGDFGRTQQGLEIGLRGALSSNSVDRVAEDIKSMLDEDLLDDEEQPSPLKIKKPTYSQL